MPGIVVRIVARIIGGDSEVRAEDFHGLAGPLAFLCLEPLGLDLGQ